MTEVAARTNPKIFKDLNWLLGLLTLVAAIMYVVVLFTVPALRQPLPLVVFTTLLALHLALHWQVAKIVPQPMHLIFYVIVQGGLFFAIGWLCGSPNMIFPLFAGLLGEAIGTLGLKRRGILGIAFFILLLIGILLLRFNPLEAGWLIVGTAAIVVSTTLYTVLYKRQVDARTQAQFLLQDLETANRQLGEYAIRVKDLTTASERQRMARELHDTLSQGLAGLILQLEAVEANLSSDRPERALQIVQEAKATARVTLADSRQAIADLRQTSLHELGEAARREAEHFTTSTGIPCAVEIALPKPLPKSVSETAFRLVTEGLTNIARHSRAKNAKLRIVEPNDSKELQIEIVDDGIGFDPNSIQAGHYGLLGMQERLRLVEGSVDVNSETGKGTRIVIRFPTEDPFDG